MTESEPGGFGPDGGHRLHRKIADRLRSDILAGRIPPGSLLPTERELHERFGVSRRALRRGLDILRAEGWVETRQGSGTRVREQPPATALELLLTIDEDARGVFLYRHAVDWILLAPTRIAWERPALDIGRRLEVEPDELIVVRDRIVGPAGGPPGQYATTYLPGWLAGQLPRLAERDTGPKGFLDLIKRAGYDLRWTVTIATRMPLPDEAEGFKLGQGQPILRLIRTTYNAADDRPVEITDYRLPGPRYEITVPLVDNRPRGFSTGEQDLAD